MEARRLAWHGATGPHEFVMTWVPGTSGTPYEFGIGRQRRTIEVKGFFIGVTPVTQALWARVMGANPAKHRDPRCPVENVSWNDCQEFVKKLNELEKQNGWLYRLPTEVEWEYACRGGPTDDKAVSGFDFYLDKPSNEISEDQAIFQGTSKRNLTKIGSFKPNKLGLYDMHGNVGEWCNDESPDSKNASHAVSRSGAHHMILALRPASGCSESIG